MKRFRSKSSLWLSLFGALTIAMLPISTASAAEPLVANDAVQACGATNAVPGSGADVPAEVQDDYLWSIPTSGDPVPIVCGNGRTYGAVPVEVKHLVPNWGDASNCMEIAIDQVRPTPGSDGQLIYRYQFGGKSVRVVTGEVGLITAFPEDGLEDTWAECSGSVD